MSETVVKKHPNERSVRPNAIKATMKRNYTTPLWFDDHGKLDVKNFVENNLADGTKFTPYFEDGGLPNILLCSGFRFHVEDPNTVASSKRKASIALKKILVKMAKPSHGVLRSFDNGGKKHCKLTFQYLLPQEARQ